MLSLEPKGNRILVQQLERKLPGGLVIPAGDGKTTNKMARWRVVKLGEEKVLQNGDRVPINVKVGDDIIFDQKHMMPLAPEFLFGGQFALVPVDAIFAVCTGEVDAIQPPQLTIATTRAELCT